MSNLEANEVDFIKVGDVSFSLDISQFAPDFLMAQKSVLGVVKGEANLQTKSMYASLTSVLLSIKEHLHGNNISFPQFPGTSSEGVARLNSMLLHKSGQWMMATCSSEYGQILKGNTGVLKTPTSYGAAMSLLRRYSLQAIMAINQFDDDGEMMFFAETNASLFDLLTPKDKSTVTDLVNQVDALIEAGDITKARSALSKTSNDLKHNKAIKTIIFDMLSELSKEALAQHGGSTSND